MDVTERKVLKIGVEDLKKSTEVKWTGGDLEDWSDYANKMKHKIDMFTKIVDELMKEENN